MNNKNSKYIVVDCNNKEIDESEYKNKYLGFKCHCKKCGCNLKIYKDVNDDYYIVGNHTCEIEKIKVNFVGPEVLDLEQAENFFKHRRNPGPGGEGGPRIPGPLPHPYANAINVDKENYINSAIKLLKYASKHNSSTSFHSGIKLKDFVMYNSNYSEILDSNKKQICFLAKRIEDVDEIKAPTLKGYNALIATFGENDDKFVVLYVKVKDSYDAKEFNKIVLRNPNNKDFIFICSTNWQKSEIKINGAIAVYETEIPNSLMYCESTTDFRRN